MEENHKEDVRRALTTDEIRQEAHKWTLAGDVGLLAHLEEFSQDLFKRSQDTQNNLNELFDSFEDASTTVSNVASQLLALQNLQFVENRVYDDESPVEEPEQDQKVSKEDQEKYLLAQYKEVVETGIKLLDSHFEEVQLPPNSDSDEEEVCVENSGLVWKQKNPYAGKRFPLLIGSAEWWADDNVGLGEYEENLNPDTLSSESESEMEVEGAPEKRIRMSSSSSTESERIVSNKTKEHANVDYDDIFAPAGKDMFSGPPNLFKQDEEDDYAIESHINPKEIDKSLPKISQREEGHIGNSHSGTSGLFDGSDDNSEEVEEERAEPDLVQVNKQNRLPNAFTKELSAKLSSVAANKPGMNSDSPKPKPSPRTGKTDDPSALFDENDDDDNDDLFSPKTTNLNPLLKKQSIFSNGDGDDQLFGNSDNLFSATSESKGTKKKVTITFDANTVKDNNSAKLFDKPNKFADDDLFNSNHDDYLFSGKSSFGSSQNSGEAGLGWKDSREVKFSTPTEHRDNLEVPNADTFGGVSAIRSNRSSRVEDMSEISNDMDNSFNFARYLGNESSKDYGYAEQSNLSNNKSEKSASPGLFEPWLSSTRHMPSDTSDYKTAGISSNQMSHEKTNSANRASDDNSKQKMGHSERPHVSRQEEERNKAKGLFADDDDGDDDLFNTSKPIKPAKEKNSLFDDYGNDDCDDLFGNLAPKSGGTKSQSLFDEKADGSNLLQKSSGPPFLSDHGDDEDRCGVVDRLKHQDSISISSSRSSLFDDVNVGKTNLASVFDNEKPSKNLNDLFGKVSTEDDLFGGKETSATSHDSDDLFSESALAKVAKSAGGESKKSNANAASLFDDLDDADDLFGGKASKKQFEKNTISNYDDNDEDLFGGSSAKTTRAKKESGSSFEASPDIKFRSSNPIVERDSKSLFDDVFKADESEKIMKITSPTTKSLFGKSDDEDDDLFGKKTKPSAVAKPGFLEKNDSNDALKFMNDEGGGDDDDDDIFKGQKTVKEKQTNKVVVTDDELFGDPSFREKKIPKHETKSDKSEYSQNILENHKSNSNNDNFGDNDLENDFFGSNKTAKSRVLENNKLFDVDDIDDNNLFGSKSLDENRLLNEKAEDGVRPSPPNTLNIVNKLSLGRNQESSEVDGTAVSAIEKPKVVIGKLSIPSNLKINPMSLLPGAVMKKNNIPSAKPPSEETGPEPEKATVTQPEKETDKTPAESGPNLLKCLSKDRVKIQVRRRPQTRRARHEALRTSGIDFGAVDAEDVASSIASRSRSVDDFDKSLTYSPTMKSSSDTNVTEPRTSVANTEEVDDKIFENTGSSRSSIFHSVENSPEETLFSSPLASNPLSPSTDEEDYFNVPELDVNFEKEDQSIFKSLLADSKSQNDKGEDNLLFDGAPVLSPMAMTTEKSFAHEGKIEEATTTKMVPKTEGFGKVGKSLLILDDEQDDLFGGNEVKKEKSQDKKKEVGVIKEAAAESDRSKGGKSNSILDDEFENGNDSFLFEKKKPTDFLASKQVPKKVSLFDDEDDDDDDLFSNKSAPAVSKKVTSPNPPSKNNNKVNKSAVAEKSKESFVDPLGLMSNPD